MSTRQEKSPDAYRTISEVAEAMDVPQHVLRFWESKFSQIKPMKRGGGRRYYRPEDVEVIQAIRSLLHEDGYTIKGAQKLLREQGVKTVVQQYVSDGTDAGAAAHGSAAPGAGAAPETGQAASSKTVSVSSGQALREDLEALRGRLKNIQKKLKGELPN